MGGMFDMLFPIVEKSLKDEKITPAFESYLSQFPIEENEVKNSIIATLEKDKVYLSVVGLGYNNVLKQFYISKIKKQMPIVEAVKTLINHAK